MRLGLMIVEKFIRMDWYFFEMFNNLFVYIGLIMVFFLLMWFFLDFLLNVVLIVGDVGLIFLSNLL